MIHQEKVKLPLLLFICPGKFIASTSKGITVTLGLKDISDSNEAGL
ncbi:hypothetical protein [Halobacillus massiliensis]|nr:hypothetical protein [Halobacillus massiliensis]